MEFILEYLKIKAMKSNVTYKHASALFCNKHIYSIGINRYIFDKRLKYFSTVHAEINAINMLKNKKNKNLDILIIRINSNGTLQMSKPCSHCICKLKKNGIRKVYYSNNNKIICEDLDNITSNHISSSEKFKTNSVK